MGSQWFDEGETSEKIVWLSTLKNLTLIDHHHFVNLLSYYSDLGALESLHVTIPQSAFIPYLGSDPSSGNTCLPLTLRHFSLAMRQDRGRPDSFAALAATRDSFPAFTHFTILLDQTVVFENPLEWLRGALPWSITRLSIECWKAPSRPAAEPDQQLKEPSPPFSTIPFSGLMDLMSELSKLERLDLPDCKRASFEGSQSSGAELVTECERRSIRIVCWEDFL